KLRTSKNFGTRTSGDKPIFENHMSREELAIFLGGDELNFLESKAHPERR
ncbi:9178_t:CDS:1, partial [Entrophospora sp. SA101]